MQLQQSFIDITEVENIKQLINYDDQSFIYCAYRTLLKRDPDDTGMLFYLGRLRAGEHKLQIVKELRESTEGKRTNVKIEGMDAAIRRFNFGRIFKINKVSKLTKNLKQIEPLNEVAPPQTVVTQPTNAVTAKRISNSDYLQKLEKNNEFYNGVNQTFWFDLTTSMEWTGGVVGIIRAELEIACGLNKLDSNIRFSMQIENGFIEIRKEQLDWLLKAENVVDAYMNFFGRYKKTTSDGSTFLNQIANSIVVEIPNIKKLFHPYKSNDVILTAGWMDSKKENLFPKVRDSLSNLYLGYLVYDIIMLHEDTTHFYDPIGSTRFHQYIHWISENCDFSLYGGETAKNDTEALQKQLGWRSPLGAAVKFGSDIMKSVNIDQELKSLAALGITGQFIITVGSIEPRKNHDTLYRAYVLALELEPLNLPQLVICGKPMWRADDLVDTIARDPRLVGKVIRISPTDSELAALYKHCAFTVLPSLYEGWSLTLPESLGQGKFCLCTDTPPLREIGKDLIDYAPGWDVRTWAEKIILYSSNKTALRTFEEKIAREWPTTRWQNTAEMVHGAVQRLLNQLPSQSSISATQAPLEEKITELTKPVIWLDITLTFLYKHEGLSGIIRTELTFARYLKKIEPDTRYFAYYDNYFFEVLPDYLIWLFDESDLASSYKMFQDYWERHETEGTGYRNPFRITQGPVVGHPANLEQLPANSIALFVGIDSDQYGEQKRTKDIFKLITPDQGIITSQLLYDFTPVLFPQFHAKATCDGYVPFIKHISNNFDHIIYGGRTAQRDGIKIQENNSWNKPISNAIVFGSNLEALNDSIKESSTSENISVLTRLGITERYIITVGTIEPRKNHEMLYKAYVTLLKTKPGNEIPQLVFIGRKGWKTNDFLATIESDKRVINKIIILTPTDDELKILYRNCLFTLLPSFYEGWSLTLPESLNYGKFCLTSDVEPLRETGRDLVEYINPLDTFSWAERIFYYSTNPAELESKENYIKENWNSTSWYDATLTLVNTLHHAQRVISEKLKINTD